MKVMVISDIHGSKEYLNKALELYKKEKAERLLILGDFCGYIPSLNDFEVGEILNGMVGEITAVIGNCDTDRTTNLLNFDLPVLRHVYINDKKITLSHGHMYGPHSLPSDCGDIFLYGHTHRGMIEKQGNVIVANPGSITKPLVGTNHSYLIIDEKEITLKDLEENVIKSLKLN